MLKQKDDLEHPFLDGLIKKARREFDHLERFMQSETMSRLDSIKANDRKRVIANVFNRVTRKEER
jgi:hypothetical protein